jgi:hypothetical protein
MRIMEVEKQQQWQGGPTRSGGAGVGGAVRVMLTRRKDITIPAAPP